MSKKYNDCDIVLELLPIYLDGKTGEESNVFVKEQLVHCADCREMHELMSADFMETGERARKETGAKKKRRFRQLSPAGKRRVLLVAGLLGYLALMIGCVALAFWILVYS